MALMEYNVTVNVEMIRLTKCCPATVLLGISNCSISPLVMGKISISDPIVNLTKVRQTWEEMMDNQQFGPELPICPSVLNTLFPTLSIIPNVTKIPSSFSNRTRCEESNVGPDHGNGNPHGGGGSGGHYSPATLAFYAMLARLSLGFRIISITSLVLTVSTLLSFSFIPGSLVTCKIVTALEHYSNMSTVLWMTILAIRLYYELIGVYSAIHFMTLSTEKLVLIAGSVAWGIPLIVIIIGLSLNSGQYGKMYGRSCANHSKWMTATYVYPMFVLVGVNIIIFIVITMKVWKLSKERKMPMTFSRLYSLLGLMSLFGLTWFVGVLAFIDSSLWLNLSHLLFAILTGSQGFLIFLFYCVAKREVRSCWAKLFCRKSREFMFTMSTRSGTDINRKSSSNQSKHLKNNTIYPAAGGHLAF